MSTEHKAVLLSIRTQFTGCPEPPKPCIRDDQYRYKPIDGLLHESGLSLKELESYLQGGTGYGLHISNLEVYDTPVGLNRLNLLADNAYNYRIGNQVLGMPIESFKNLMRKAAEWVLTNA